MRVLRSIGSVNLTDGRAGFTLLRHRILLGLRHILSPPKVRQSR